MKTDARVRYTKRVLKESMLKVLAEKPVQKITVKELCELAQVNRATFYLHYHDPFDLLEQIENEVFEDISTTVITASNDVNTIARKVFTTVKKDADLFKVLFSENGDRMFLQRIIDVSRSKTVADWRQQYPQATEQQLDFLYTFIISGSVAVIEQWVRTGMKEEIPLDVGDIAKKCIDSWSLTQK